MKDQDFNYECPSDKFSHLEKRIDQLEDEANRLDAEPSCPDCNFAMVKTWIECEDGSGWYCGWLCECKMEDNNES